MGLGAVRRVSEVLNWSENSMTTQDALERQGLAWVNRLLSGEMMVSEAADLRRWCAYSPAHQVAFAKAVHLHKSVQLCVEVRRTGALAQPVKTLDPSRYRIERRLFLGGALAAGAAYCVVHPPAHLWPALAELNADYRTGKGERRMIAVASNVSVELNTQTSVNFVKDGARRAVSLVSGQAAVSTRGGAVAILAGFGHVMIKRGAVDVFRDENGVRVTCSDGVTMVRHAQQTVALEAGHELTYTQDDFGAPRAVDPSIATAWQLGLLIFRNAPLTDVVREMNRYRAGRIIVADEALGRRTVYGVFEIAHLDRAIQQVHRLTGAKITALPADVVVLG